MSSIELRHSRRGRQKEFVKLKPLLVEHGNPEIICEVTARKYMSVLHRRIKLGVKCEDVILTDAKRRSDHKAYILLHTVILEATGLGHSVFYALLPSESADSYRRAVQSMARVLPATRNCRTLVVDRILAQNNAISDSLLNCRVMLCQFHVL